MPGDTFTLRCVGRALRDFGFDAVDTGAFLFPAWVVGLALLGFNGAGIVGRALLAGAFGFDGVGVLACGRAVWIPKISFSGRRCPARLSLFPVWIVCFGAFLLGGAFGFDTVGFLACGSVDKASRIPSMTFPGRCLARLLSRLSCSDG